MRLTAMAVDGRVLRVIIVAVGGASCSGKTTLAKYLRSCLPGSFIIHQDDFAPPQEQVPVHTEYGVQDWDDAPGAIEWARLAGALECVRRTGALPAEHRSHDHLNEQELVAVDEAVLERWREAGARAAQACAARGERVVWAIADGFLLYWSAEVVRQLDVRVFLRVSRQVLERRRDARHGYHTAEGALWRDPPHYFEQIVYPAYVRAHRDMFVDGDVEGGPLTGTVTDLMLFEGERTGLGDILGLVMARVLEVTEAHDPEEPLMHKTDTVN